VRNDRLAMKMQKRTPAQRAAEYLKRVARLTGAEHVHDETYRLRAGRRSFLVDYKLVRVISRRGEATCFSVAADPDIPSAEVVASALLQLKSNPRLFEKWRQLQGHAFKANGKMFKSADLVGWR
jgi:hypothetical protein